MTLVLHWLKTFRWFDAGIVMSLCIDAVNQGNWSLSIKWRGEAFVIVDKNY